MCHANKNTGGAQRCRPMQVLAAPRPNITGPQSKEVWETLHYRTIRQHTDRKWLICYAFIRTSLLLLQDNFLWMACSYDFLKAVRRHTILMFLSMTQVNMILVTQSLRNSPERNVDSSASFVLLLLSTMYLL